MARSETPGLQWRQRKNGERIAYWYARPELIKRGYRPRSVRLHYNPDDPIELAALCSRCERLQSEMWAWAGNSAEKGTGIYDGSLARLVNLYETDADSPYRDLKQETGKSYSKMMRLLLSRVGEAYLDQLTGADVMRWFRAISAPKQPGAPPRFAYANLIIKVLKSVLSYGVNQGYEDCAKLRGQLSLARFRHGAARREFPSYEQVVAFRAAAHELGRPSAALWVTLQFELGLRRRDIIGEWVDDRTGTDGIRLGRMLWRDGLTWSHIDASGVLRKMVSKTEHSTGRVAVHRIAEYPDLVTELDQVPVERRVGPIVISESTGLPYNAEQCRRCFRRIARKAGIPDTLWNMDLRSGAVTEAYEAGATTEGAMALAAHTEVGTSRRYLRDTLNQTSRVAKLRIEGRTSKQNESTTVNRGPDKSKT